MDLIKLSQPVYQSRAGIGIVAFCIDNSCYHPRFRGKGIRKAGFEYVGKLYIDSNDIVTIDENESSLAYQAELDYMDIRLSAYRRRLCWLQPAGIN